MATLYLKPRSEKQVRRGYPWIMAGDIEPTSELLMLQPGELVAIADPKGKAFATGYYNARSHIAARLLSLKPNDRIDTKWLVDKLRKALQKREKSVAVPYYRLVHSESDGLPGLVIDRFGDICVLQVTTAGMERLTPALLEALEEVMAPQTVILRNDVDVRSREGLQREVKVVKGGYAAPTQIREYETLYLADLVTGQKTGWFYDQRDNRQQLAALCKGKSMLDVYSYTGGFGIAAAKAGARAVTFVDSSAPALIFAKEALALNDTKAEAHFVQQKAFDALQELQDANQRFDVVSLDPPAFIQTRADVPAGLKGYEKLVRLAAPLLAPDGVLLVSSCSHHAPKAGWLAALEKGLKKGGRGFRLTRFAGAAPDHPVHPLLPQSAYLKAATFAVD